MVGDFSFTLDSGRWAPNLVSSDDPTIAVITRLISKLNREFERMPSWGDIRVYCNFGSKPFSILTICPTNSGTLVTHFDQTGRRHGLLALMDRESLSKPILIDCGCGDHGWVKGHFFAREQIALKAISQFLENGKATEDGEWGPLHIDYVEDGNEDIEESRGSECDIDIPF